MRATVDTNITVSALLKLNSGPGRVIELFRAKRFTLVISEPMLAELAEVLARAKFTRRGVTPEKVDELLQALRSGADVVLIPGKLQICRDPDDDCVIETAVAGAADLLVSGDKDLTETPAVAELLARAGTRVVTVREFLQLLGEVPGG